MSTCSISIIPATKGVSVSGTIARCLKALKSFPDLKWELTPMSTQIEGTTSRILEAVQAMHQAAFEAGVPRVYTVVTIDERRDKTSSLQDKVTSVKNKLPS